MTDISHRYSLDRSEVVKLLKSHGISPTRQRVEIAEFLFRKQQHISAESILEGVNQKSHRVSRATVYNSMGLFAKKGLVREVLIDRERVFYDSNSDSHHHIYNMDTGELMDIEDSGIEIAGLPVSIDGARVVDTDVIVKVSSK